MSSSVPTHSAVALGFLTVLREPTGWLGGYLITNGWGRPLEFRLTTAVQPNRIQTALYGPTLTEYLHADLIGRTLVEKTGLKPDLVVTDVPAVLPLRSRIELPVVALHCPDGEAPSDSLLLTTPRSSKLLLLPSRFENDRGRISELLERVDASVDLSEPFTRIRDAIAEHRKLGVSHRAA